MGVFTTSKQALAGGGGREGGGGRGVHCMLNITCVASSSVLCLSSVHNQIAPTSMLKQNNNDEAENKV